MERVEDGLSLPLLHRQQQLLLRYPADVCDALLFASFKHVLNNTLKNNLKRLASRRTTSRRCASITGNRLKLILSLNIKSRKLSLIPI